MRAWGFPQAAANQQLQSDVMFFQELRVPEFTAWHKPQPVHTHVHVRTHTCLGRLRVTTLMKVEGVEMREECGNFLGRAFSDLLFLACAFCLEAFSAFIQDKTDSSLMVTLLCQSCGTILVSVLRL